MSLQKLDFVVQQAEELQEASTSVKAGAAVTFSWTEANDLVQVMYDGTILGSVPRDQQHHLQVSLPPGTVRSVRKQDGKVTQILVRADLSSANAKVPQLPGKQQSSLLGS